MAEPRINGLLRVMNGNTNMRTLKEMNDLLTSINNNLNKIINYSTSEQIIGKWIDGKTLYRQVLTLDKPNGAARDVSIPTPTNIDTMVHMEVMGKNDVGEFMILPNNTISYANGNTPRGATFFTKNAPWNANHVYIVEIERWVHFHVIIEYTKV